MPLSPSRVRWRGNPNDEKGYVLVNEAKQNPRNNGEHRHDPGDIRLNATL